MRAQPALARARAAHTKSLYSARVRIEICKPDRGSIAATPCGRPLHLLRREPTEVPTWQTPIARAESLQERRVGRHLAMAATLGTITVARVTPAPDGRHSGRQKPDETPAHFSAGLPHGRSDRVPGRGSIARVLLR